LGRATAAQGTKVSTSLDIDVDFFDNNNAISYTNSNCCQQKHQKEQIIIYLPWLLGKGHNKILLGIALPKEAR
jgi:hypothetical protein